ncbi:uncharacterized protein LOC113862850 isoform X2 [Abrus precatorius]|uniref:Uncharacterized protein LOC113862850 isoform X2 n=1 Tax=Abrus precatorius TaxID=3816 RepID=A0A8B8L6S0_ABRPR|nr:uncharacterized protein LOC113862850 isoform X2 [Abrus precatorius]
MRIRKRQVLFSSLSLSDPHLINRSPVVVVQLSDATSTAPKSSSTQHAASAPPSTIDPSHPFDQSPTNGSDHPSSIGHSGQHNKQDPLDEEVRGEESGGDSGEKGNHIRKERIFGSEVLPPSSPSFTQDGRWCEGEKAIPLKKRRGSFEENNAKKMKARMKTKMNKKCSMNNMEEEEEDEEEEKGEETKVDVSVSKKRARGSALMEGSRCSRVNGRGWRCCQQTLVGYSLCEHHLGKGRLRSMTSVRSRSVASTAPKKVMMHDMLDPSLSSSSSSLEKQTTCVADPLEEDEKKPVIITKKRMKLGMVKARSISSLLGQTTSQNNIGVAHDENNK